MVAGKHGARANGNAKSGRGQRLGPASKQAGDRAGRAEQTGRGTASGPRTNGLKTQEAAMAKASAGSSKGQDAAQDKGRLQALERALGQIEKTFGSGSIMRLDGDANNIIPGINTGALSLDLALGGRGVPRGRVVEVYGNRTDVVHSLPAAR